MSTKTTKKVNNYYNETKKAVEKKAAETPVITAPPARELRTFEQLVIDTINQNMIGGAPDCDKILDALETMVSTGIIKADRYNEVYNELKTQFENTPALEALKTSSARRAIAAFIASQKYVKGSKEQLDIIQDIYIFYVKLPAARRPLMVDIMTNKFDMSWITTSSPGYAKIMADSLNKLLLNGLMPTVAPFTYDELTRLKTSFFTVKTAKTAAPPAAVTFDSVE